MGLYYCKLWYHVSGCAGAPFGICQSPVPVFAEPQQPAIFAASKVISETKNITVRFALAQLCPE